jgi:autotransporter-associated beta strand protein
VRISNAANTYSGAITVNGLSPGRAGGRLLIEHAQALRFATVINQSPRVAPVAFGVSTVELGGLGGSGALTLPSVLLSVGGNGVPTEYTGALSGSGGLTKLGPGEWTLNGNHTYSGNTVVAAGLLRLNGSLSSAGTVSVEDGATLELNGTLTVNRLTIQTGGRLVGSGVINAPMINFGLILADGPGIKWFFNGTSANRGVMRLTRGASFSGTGSFANQALLDLITAGPERPAKFSSSGTVLEAGLIRPEQFQLVDGAPQLSIFGYSGHHYQLQRSLTLAGAEWEDVGDPQAGTGSLLFFTAPGDTPASASQRFFRVVVDP